METYEYIVSTTRHSSVLRIAMNLCKESREISVPSDSTETCEILVSCIDARRSTVVFEQQIPPGADPVEIYRIDKVGRQVIPVKE